MSDEPRLGTVEVAERLGVSAERVRQYSAAGRLPFEYRGHGAGPRKGWKRVYREADVAALEAEREARRAGAY